MARRKRRDEDAVDERLDQETDETPDEAAEDSDDDALDPEDLDDELESEDDDLDEDDDEDEDAEPAGRRGGTAVKRAKAGSGSETRSKAKTKPGKADKAKRPERVGPIGRLLRFVREVVAELRKVIWPTRKELLTYTAVVVVFVTVMLGIIALFDLGFAKAMLWVFGSNTAQE